jgi:hypothetical protein
MGSGAARRIADPDGAYGRHAAFFANFCATELMIINQTM